MNEEKLLAAEKIEKEFPGTKALKGVSVDLRKGEVHAVAGENGAGKSTLMNILSGGMRQTSGNIYIEGKQVSFSNTKEAQKAGIGLVHQELALPQRKGFVHKEELNRQASEVLEQFHSGIKPTQLVEELSVSEQQIVEIAKVVSEECRIIIFDEPTSSLNEEEACQLFKIIGELKKREWAFTISAISCLKFLRSATGLRS